MTEKYVRPIPQPSVKLLSISPVENASDPTNPDSVYTFQIMINGVPTTKEFNLGNSAVQKLPQDVLTALAKTQAAQYCAQQGHPSV